MKIVYLHQYFNTPAMSGGTRSYEMARRMVAAGHEVHMVTTARAEGEAKDWRETDEDGIRVHWLQVPYSNYMSLPRRAKAFFNFAFAATRKAVELKGDLIYATSTPLTIAIPAIRAARKTGAPMVFEVRDLWPELPKAMGVVKNPLVLAGMAWLEKAAYRKAKGCVGLSPGIVEGIRKKAGANKPLAMIPNGCDLELIRPAEQPGSISAVCRRHFEQHGVPLEGFRAIFTGAHGLANGLDAVLDAAAELKRRGRDDIHLLFMGDGRTKPGLRERAEREGLSNCHFLDPAPKQDMVEILRGVHAGLMILANVPAFYYGTSPNKFFDYLSAGLPVLNNYPGWLAETLAREDCGLAVPPAEPGAFADALEGMADDPAAAAAMGRRARALAERQFSRDRLAADLLAFIAPFGVAD